MLLTSTGNRRIRMSLSGSHCPVCLNNTDTMSYTRYRNYVVMLVVLAWCAPGNSGLRASRSKISPTMTNEKDTNNVGAHQDELSLVRPNHFYAVAKMVETDKVIGHHYEVLYDKYLHAIADKKLRLLESTHTSRSHTPSLLHTAEMVQSLRALLRSWTWL